MDKQYYVIVEDSEDDLEFILDGLRKVTNTFEQKVLTDGRQADHFITDLIDMKRELPKMMLLDLKLPMLTGLEILEKLKGHEYTRKIPVIIFTSSQSHGDVEKAYEIGVNAFVVKPIDYKQFILAAENIGKFWLGYNI
ncbi:response regulator [Fulvivirga ligni]|uniref:response regulator n=1 Tax=Fulvivirga ligni TaxID=2904246 RepID=UPI001F1B77A0|nr:response regulator [Fulvivirga ligni]UII23059.1 response regulator [Fulvivirga ligni]